MVIIEWVTPADSEVWPCPEACGGLTEDPYGGPCAACWRAIEQAGRAERDGDDG